MSWNSTTSFCGWSTRRIIDNDDDSTDGLWFLKIDDGMQIQAWYSVSNTPLIYYVVIGHVYTDLKYEYAYQDLSDDIHEKAMALQMKTDLKLISPCNGLWYGWFTLHCYYWQFCIVYP